MNVWETLVKAIDLVFVKGAGIIYVPSAYIKIGDVEIFLPCSFSIRGRKRVIITEIEGSNNSVKEILGLSDYVVSLTIKVFDYDSSPEAKMAGIGVKGTAAEIIQKLYQEFIKNQAIPIIDVTGSKINLLGEAMKSLDILDISEPVSIFDMLGIERIVIQEFDIDKPENSPHLIVRIKGISDKDELDLEEIAKQINLFLEEK